MPTGTTYAPVSTSEFKSTKVQYAARGVSATCTLNAVTNIDLAFTEDHLLTGFWILGKDITLGDKISLQVIDSSNVFGYGAGTVLKEFATNIYITDNLDAQFEVLYPAKVIAGLSIRVVYTSTGTTGNSPFFAANYKLHKIVV